VYRYDSPPGLIPAGCDGVDAQAAAAEGMKPGLGHFVHRRRNPMWFGLFATTVLSSIFLAPNVQGVIWYPLEYANEQQIFRTLGVLASESYYWSLGTLALSFNDITQDSAGRSGGFV
jgi:hypothetical protein